MGKKRARLIPIENKKSRSDTFHKRKMGLLKKAAELAILCNIKLLLIFEDLSESVIQFSAHEHFNPSTYAQKKIIKLSLADYPGFFKKHEKENGDTQNGDMENHDSKGPDSHPDGEESNGDEDDSTSEISETNEKNVPEKPKNTNTNSATLNLSMLQNLTNSFPASTNIDTILKSLNSKELEPVSVKTEYDRHDKGSKRAEINNGNEFEMMNNSLLGTRAGFDCHENLLKALEKKALEGMVKNLDVDHLSFAMPSAGFNPTAGFMDPKRGMSSLGLQFGGLDQMSLQRMNPMLLGKYWVGGLEGNNKMTNPLMMTGENQSGWFSRYYQNYLKAYEDGMKNQQSISENTDQQRTGNENLLGTVEEHLEAQLKKKVKK